MGELAELCGLRLPENETGDSCKLCEPPAPGDRRRSGLGVADRPTGEAPVATESARLTDEVGLAELPAPGDRDILNDSGELRDVNLLPDDTADVCRVVEAVIISKSFVTLGLFVSCYFAHQCHSKCNTQGYETHTRAQYGAGTTGHHRQVQRYKVTGSNSRNVKVNTKKRRKTSGSSGAVCSASDCVLSPTEWRWALAEPVQGPKRPKKARKRGGESTVGEGTD